MSFQAAANFLKQLAQKGYKVAPNSMSKNPLAKVEFSLARFNQYGLLSDDCLLESPEVKEALRRLPMEVQQERLYRITSALDMSAKKMVLPREQWTTMENDIKYLQPYLKEVMREKEEAEAWENESIKI